jgi:hypothetical protein
MAWSVSSALRVCTVAFRRFMRPGTRGSSFLRFDLPRVRDTCGQLCVSMRYKEGALQLMHTAQ